MPLPHVCTNTDPYILDKVHDSNGNEYAALTRKNANFIEAVVGLDSNYKQDMTNTPPDVGFDINRDFNDSKGKFCGSIKYWFEKMTQPGTNYSECLLGAVTAVDRSNSTHLETVRDGRKVMRDRIMFNYPTLNDLKIAIDVPYTYTNTKHIIFKLTQGGMYNIKNGSETFFISFASKFITYASIILNSKQLHSKYDGVVSDNLPVYSELYLGKSFGKTSFKVKNIKFSKKRSDGLKMYGEYVKVINDILGVLSGNGINLSREEFDHIVWYCTKGR